MEQTATAPIRLRARFYGLKRLIASIICHPWAGRAIAAIFRERIPANGLLINTDCEAVAPTLKAALFWGIYESAEMRFVKEYLRGDLDVVELGSSLGVVSCQILKKLEPGSRLVCVEANPHLLGILRENLKQQSDGHDVRVVHGAVADASNENSLVHVVLAADSTASHVVSGNEVEKVISVPALTLSGILRDNHIDQSFSLVSDIEGAETSFIENDDMALGRCEQLLIELHETSLDGNTVSVDQLRNRLEKAHGFTLRESYGPVCLFERFAVSRGA